MDKPKNFDESGEALKLGWFPLLVVLIAWASIIVLSCYAYRGPTPQPDDIVDELFSAERAKVYLQQLVGDSIPHPAGSQQNKIVRQRIVEMLKSFGYSVEIQSGSGEVNASVRDRSPDEEVLSLHNIIAVRKSKSSNQSKKKLMLFVSVCLVCLCVAIENMFSTPFAPISARIETTEGLNERSKEDQPARACGFARCDELVP